MSSSSTTDYEKSRRVTESCKDFIRTQVCTYLVKAKGDPSRELIVALAEVAAEFGFHVFGKDFVQTLFYGLGGSVNKLDDSQSLKSQLRAAGFNVCDIAKNTKN